MYNMEEIAEKHSKRRIKTGSMGEKAVDRLLSRFGYTNIARNMALYKGKKIGEIDILSIKNDVLYIVEVRTGRNPWDREDRLPQRKRQSLLNILKELYVLRAQLRHDVVHSPDPGIDLRFSPSVDLAILNEALVCTGKIVMVLAEVRLPSGFPRPSASNKCHIEFSLIHPYS